MCKKSKCQLFVLQVIQTFCLEIKRVGVDVYDVSREKLSRGKLKCTAGVPFKSPITVDFLQWQRKSELVNCCGLILVTPSVHRISLPKDITSKQLSKVGWPLHTSLD